ncbi:MAG: RHS domain-containing protein, partial [Rhodocyclaceae bacterium]|nr:RHS domain-containing protein [Rhodocyclaceae bacterium]
QHFRYDDEDRLIAVRTQNPHGISETTFTYDALGRRSARTCVTEPATAPQATYTEQRRYVWSGLRLLQDIGAGCVTTYVYDPDDDYSPLARIDQTLQPDGSLDPGAPRCYWFHTDQIGTPLELTDAEGRTAWAGRHKAWGRVDGIAPARGALEQPLRFQGQYADASTGLHYNTFRYYDPDVGRFASHDPIGIAGGENLYAYAPNPTGWVDPWAWCATALGKNMEAAGIKRPPNTTPHHIAGDTSKASLRGRNVLAKHGINADDAVNGVFLPNRANVDPAVPGILHNGRHPNAYVEAVNDRLIQASNIGGKQQVLKELDAIRRELLQAARNAKWSNIL